MDAAVAAEPKFDLEERTATFGERIIIFAQAVPQNTVTRSLIDQLVRSGTSIGVNYCEADNAESRKDFEHKLGIAQKEANETKHWLRMAATAVPQCAAEARGLWKEADELQRILITIIRNSRQHASQ